MKNRAFFLCHGRVYREGKSRWTQKHFRWLEEQQFAHPVQQVVFQEYVDTVVETRRRVVSFYMPSPLHQLRLAQQLSTILLTRIPLNRCRTPEFIRPGSYGRAYCPQDGYWSRGVAPSCAASGREYQREPRAEGCTANRLRKSSGTSGRIGQRRRKREPMTSSGGKGARPVAVRPDRRDG